MIAKDMNPYDALLEYRLNLKHQYSDILAFIVVDISVMKATQEIAYKLFKKY